MSATSVLEFERAIAVVTFDMPVSNGNTTHIAFNRDLMNASEKSIQICIWNEKGNNFMIFILQLVTFL